MASAHAPRCDSPPLTLRSSAETTFACTRARARANVACDDDARVSQSCVRILSVSPFRRVTCYIRCSAWSSGIPRFSQIFVDTSVPSGVFQEWNFSAKVLLYSGAIRHFFSVSCSLISLFFSLFLARSQALELEHLSRESEESATRYGPERANLLLHSPPVSSLAFYSAFLPVFARLHFCTRAHIALARVFLENRGLLLWGRPTDGLRNRRCSLTVCRGASAAPPSRLVLPPVALRASFDRVPLSLSILLLPLLSSPASSVCLRSSLSRSRTHAAQVIVFRPIFPRDR